MDIERKLKALERIYAVYDEFIRSQESACRMHCTLCCTTHVTLTTLEAYKIRHTLPADERQRLLGRIETVDGPGRFRPRVTINRLAALSAEGREPPAENDAPAGGRCPLLAAELCSIYALRPFHCRCFISRTPCPESGAADVDDFLLAVNTVFLQTLEHLDADGCSGNLLDVLDVLSRDETCAAYAVGGLHCTGNGLIANAPLSVLMVPPEHRARLEPILQKLRGVRV
jgi:Fe-S-cluster containining protein